jgi:ubiquinone/menaquinone biosynthesis C-methylase UbiE
LKTNRLISRSEAEQLDLTWRVTLEARIMDQRAEEKLNQIDLDIQSGWQFADYAGSTPYRKYLFDFLGPLQGKTILDLGCGVHPTPVYFALAGAAHVYACDVSKSSLIYMEKLADQLGLNTKVDLIQCAGEKLPFPGESVDLIHGESVLQRLDRSSAAQELTQILKPGGKAGFKDPLGQNRLLEWVRDYIPYKGKHGAKGTDRPMVEEDLRQIATRFARSRWKGFNLCSMAGKFIVGRGNSPWVQLGYRLDEKLVLRFVPWLRRYCQYVVLCLEKSS